MRMQTIRSHFFDVVEEEPVEEDPVGILQSGQIDMPLKLIVLPLVALIRPDALLIKRARAVDKDIIGREYGRWWARMQVSYGCSRYIPLRYQSLQKVAKN